jgi:hypothetical protein
VCGNLSGGAARLKRGVGFLLAAAGAGENFFPWLKSRKPAPLRGWLKKIIVRKEAVKSGENEFRGGRLSGWHRRC